jgi:hypothetical protein
LIDHGFDAQYTPMFVVHFNPVLIHPVFNPRSGVTGFEFVQDLALKERMEFSTEKGQDILGAEAHRGVMQQFFIKALEGGGVLEQNIGGKFGLIGNPVIRHSGQKILGQGIDLSGEGGQDSRPVLFHQAVGEPLSPFKIVDLAKGVIGFNERKPVFTHLFGQPLVAVDIDLDLKGKPGLEADMDPPELPVEKIEVVEQAFSKVVGQAGPPFAGNQFKGRTGLDGGQRADQTLGQAVFLDDPPDEFLLVARSRLIDKRSSGPLGDGLGVGLEPLGLFHDEGFEILDQDLLTIEKAFHRFGIIDRQMTFEDDAVEAVEGSQYILLMLLDKMVHGVLLD